MKKEYLLLNTVTNALRAQEVLQRNGIRAHLSRLPKSIAGIGCGYCVSVQDTVRATAVLTQAGIKLYGTYTAEQ